MSLRVQWNDDDTLTIECGDESVTITPPQRAAAATEREAEPVRTKAPRPSPLPAPAPPEPVRVPTPLPSRHRHKVMIYMPAEQNPFDLPSFTIPWTRGEEFARGLMGLESNELAVEIPRGLALDIGEIQGVCELAGGTRIGDPLRLFLLPKKR